MPNTWEEANGLNPSDPSDNNKDIDEDGYTNIEEYINGILTEEIKVDIKSPQNLRVNH